MNTTTAATDRVDLEAIESGPDQSRMNLVGRSLRGARSMKRAVVLTLAVASALVLQPTSAFAAVTPTAGSGYGSETVYCNSSNHTVTVSFISLGIGNSAGSSYRVWSRYRVYVYGQWHTSAWQLTPNSATTAPLPITAGTTSYWYFDWAFEYAPNQAQYISEWAHGQGTYGWYSDQRGYQTLPSCKT
jgi:hypothetical protein